MKRCAACNKLKQHSEFYCSAKFKSTRCKPCIRKRKKDLRQKQQTQTPLRTNNRTGARGVCRVRREGRYMYRAQAGLNGKKYHLGYYEDVLDAICAASDFRIKHSLNPEETT